MTTEENAVASQVEATETTPAAVENAADTPKPDGEDTGDEATGNDPSKVEGQDDGEKVKKPNRKPASERIAELTRAKHEAEKRARAAEERLASLEAPAPKRADYKDADEYEAERAKWAAKAARGDDAKHEAETAKAQAAEAKAAAWNEQRAEILTRHSDFDAVINSVPGDVFSQSVADAILESEMAADVAYVLAKDIPRARKFAAMTPLQQGREIGRIEAELAPKPRKLSSAPPPVETLGAGTAGSAADPSKMSMAEYVRWRKSQKD